eukprot:TRINITY_DN62657_c0_g1_i1.p1 TRINITY_DN62657_c0_g1~~TRINITY_DN62657_c0_g1_i1.p1  ORF type:complete len:289 (-),score=25.94 TRINITY_DN62657_c0_g1_i1:54-893(-)
MRVIFLDIDGVLVTRRPCIMEEKLLQNLARVVKETGAKIVLSSDWRRHPEARAEATQVLESNGMELIGYTPCKSPYLAQRPTEIMEWKRNYQRTPGAEKWENWVAIDDRELLNEQHGRYLRGHFVQTHPLRGLTEEAANACIAILTQDPPKNEPPAGGSLPGPGQRSISLEPAGLPARPSTSDQQDGKAFQDLEGIGRLGLSPAAKLQQAGTGRTIVPASHVSAANAARALRLAGGGAVPAGTALGIPAGTGSRPLPTVGTAGSRVRGRSMGSIGAGRR